MAETTFLEVWKHVKKGEGMHVAEVVQIESS